MKYEICNINDFDEQQYAEMYRAANEERRARADRFRYEDDRRRCLCADMLARRMLADADLTYGKFRYLCLYCFVGCGLM